MNKLANLKKKLANKKGFTLVEMIIVMVIMAILAAALIPTMMGYIKDAKNNQNVATARAYYVAAQAVATELIGKGTTLNANGSTITSDARWTSLTASLPGAGATTAVKMTVEATTGKITELRYNAGTKTDTVVLTPGTGADGGVTFSSTF